MLKSLAGAASRVRIKTSFHMENSRLAVLRDFTDVGLLMILIGPVWFSLAYPPELPGLIKGLRTAASGFVAATCVLAPYLLAFATV